MAVNKAEKSGKWSEVATWSLKHVPEAKEDAEILTGITVKLEAEGKCRSLNIKGTGILEGTALLTIGNSEKPENPAGAVMEIASGERIKGTVQLRFISTFTTSVQKISAFTSTSTKNIQFSKTAKYELTGAITVTPRIQLGFEEGDSPELNTKGFAASSEALTVGRKAKLVTEATVWTCTTTAGVSGLVAEVETTITAGTGTFKVSANLFSEGTHTFNTVELEGENQEIKPGTLTIEKLVLTKAGKSTKVLKGTTMTLGNLEAPESKAGSLTKIESSEAGKEFKLIFTKATTVKNLAVKDSHATATEGGKFEPVDEYEGVTEAEVNISGNEHWNFKAVSTTTAVEGTVKIKLADSASLKALLTPEATAKIKFVDSLSTSQSYAVKGTTRILFTNPALAIALKLRVAGTTRILFTPAASASTFNQLAGTTQIKFSTALTPTWLAAVRGTTRIKLAASDTTKVSYSLSGTTLMRFTAHGNVTPEGRVAKRVSIFIFED